MYKVVKSCRMWDVVDEKGEVMEGGFFDKRYADDCCEVYNNLLREQQKEEQNG